MHDSYICQYTHGFYGFWLTWKFFPYRKNQHAAGFVFFQLSENEPTAQLINNEVESQVLVTKNTGMNL